MDKNIRRHFGKIMVLPIILMVFIANSMGWNLSYNEFFEKILHKAEIDDFIFRRQIAMIGNILGLLIVTGGFFLFSYYFRHSKRLVLFLFIPFIVLFQFFLISSLVDINAANKNFSYDSNSGVAGVIIIPVTIILSFLVAWYFDKVKNISIL